MLWYPHGRSGEGGIGGGQSGHGLGLEVEPVLGFIGVGNIGAPMCRCLLDRGYDVLVHDKDSRALEQFRGTSAKRVSSVSEIARAADVAILSLPNSTVVERVVFGEGGLEGGSPGVRCS